MPRGKTRVIFMLRALLPLVLPSLAAAQLNRSPVSQILCICCAANLYLAKVGLMHQAYIEAVTSKATADRRIKAAWLEGSFGRGTPDRYSDLDFHFLLADADLLDFKADAEAWLGSIQPVVLFNLLFDGKMVNALTQNGLRIDIWLHTEAAATLDPSKARVLTNKGDYIHLVRAPRSIDAGATAQILERQTKEFWRCIALLPSVVGRNELITACIGLTVETTLLTDIILTGYGIKRDRGVKNLNQFLPADVRQAIELALSMDGLSPASLTKAHLALARIMQQQGRKIAAEHRYTYPGELEAAVLRYVSSELALLSMHDGQEQAS